MKKTVLLITSILLILTVFTSCNILPTEPPEEKEPENLIYNETSELQIVLANGVPSDEIDVLWKAIGDASGNYPEIVYESAEEKKHEIVIGNAHREVSDTAYRQLDRLQKNKETDQGIVFYSNGSSIAIAYNEDDTRFTFSEALAAFIESYAKEELILEEKVAYSESFDLYERMAEKEAIERAAAWEEFERNLPTNAKAITDAYRSFYGLYSMDMMRWVANLYDPDICVCDELYGLTECTGEYALCGTAGFHYTSSARDTVGYLPVVEAMHSIMNLVVNVGFTDSYITFFPEDIKEKMGQFVYNLQDPDGYFYHPQWGKKISTGRRGRDLNWCTTLLGAFGLNSKYPTIKDASAASYLTNGDITGRLGGSAAALVSSVVAAESEAYIPENLVSLDAFKSYLSGLEATINTNSYGIGNDLNTQMTQIHAREKATKEPFCETLGQWLDDHQLDNGLWHPVANYAGVNGLMKIAGVYSSLKRGIPNVDKSIAATAAAITSDENPTGIVDVWNPWSALADCLSNMRTYRSSEEAAAIRRNMLDSMDEAISASMYKLSLFLKSDGSYSYLQDRATSTMQGAPCSVPGINEGDMDGVALAVFMVGSINSVLGMSKYRVPIFGKSGGLEFIDIMKNASPIRKAGGAISQGEPESFDDAELGEVFSNTVSVNGSGASIVADPREDATGNVLYFDGTKEKYEFVSVKCANPNMNGASCYVFEGEICVASKPQGGDNMRLSLGTADEAKSLHSIFFMHDDTGISLWEVSSIKLNVAVKNDLGFRVSYGEWFKVRVEYYLGNSETTRIKIFLNDKLYAVTDNYYDFNGNKTTETVEPNTKFDRMLIYTPVPMDVDFYLDNTHAYKSTDGYMKQTLDYEYGINVDEEPAGEKVYDLDDYTAEGGYPKGLSVEGTASVRDAGEGKELLLLSGASVTVARNLRDEAANCQRVSLDVNALGVSAGTVADISLVERNSSGDKLTAFKLMARDSDGRVEIYVTDPTGAPVSGVSFYSDETVTLTLDYYENEKATLFYINGILRGVSVYATSNASRLIFGKVVLTATADFAVDNLVCDYVSSSFEKATTPKYPTVVYDGNTTTFDAIEREGSVTVTAGSDAQLSIDSSSAPTAVTIPVNKRDTSTSVLIASFTIGIGDLSVGAAYDIMALDSEGNPIIAFVAYSDGETLHLRESTEYGTHGANVVTLDKTKENALRLECFAAEGVCNIYLNGECVFVTTLYYSEANRYLEPKSFAFLSKSASSVITLDDIVVDSYNKIYIKEDVEVKEDSDTVYTFDYAGGMNIPAGITGSKGKLSVSEVLKDGEADKALLFSPNNKDTESMSIPLKNKEQVENASCYVFESEMSFKSGKNDVKYEINFYNGNGNDAIAYRISVVFDNKVFLRDNDGRKTGEATYPVAEFNGWFKLRAEYYPIIDENGEDALRVKVFVNGEHLYTSVHPWGNGTYGGDVETSLTRVEIYACASTETPVYLDNISFTSNNEEYVKE